MEKYQIISQGQLCVGFKQEDVVKNLVARLKLSEKRAVQLLSNKNVCLKAKLPFADAQKYKNLLSKIGLMTTVRMQLDRECLQAGLVKANENHVQNCLNVFWQYDEKLVSPSIYAMPCETDLSSLTKTEKITVKLYNGIWNGAVLLVFLFLCGFILQQYLARAMVYYFGMGSLGSLLALCFWGLIVAVLPKLLQSPLSIRFDFSTGVGNKENSEKIGKRIGENIGENIDESIDESIEGIESITMLEEPSLLIGHRKFRLFNTSGDPLGYLIYKKNKLTLFSQAGELEASWDNEVGIQESAEDAARELKGLFIDNFLFDIAESVWQQLTSVLKSGISQNTPKWKNENALPIRTPSANVLAQVYRSPSPAIKLCSPEMSQQDCLKMFAIGWVIMGAYIV